MLIEDDEADARMVRGMLRRVRSHSFFLTHVTRLSEAVPHLKAVPFDAILLDLSLPDVAGLEALETVHAAAPNRPVIMLTGNDDEALALRAVHTHAQDYLVKWEFTEQFLCRSILYGVERQRVRHDLEEARNAAIAANHFKSEFLSNVSHELRTPMNSILGMTDLLSATKLEGEQLEYVSRLKHASEHLLALIGDLLDFGQIEAHGLRLESVTFAPRAILSSVIDILGDSARKKSIDLRLDVTPGVPEALVGDPTRLRQVLVNLVGNAVKFTERGSIEVSAHRRGADPAVVTFTVSDTGIGIPADQIDRIFGRFARAHPESSLNVEGSGLGLAIARSLVEMMGGELSVISHPGEGSTFRFTVAFGAAAGPSDTISGVRPVAQREPATPLKILFADDHDDNRFLIESYVRGTPHELDMVENGALALEAFRRGRYDLVLMDVHMPIMGGLQATREMRAWEQDHDLDHTPIIALTADAMPASLTQCREAGCDECLTKPIRREVLLETLARVQARAVTNGAVPEERATEPESVTIEVDPDLFTLMPGFLKKRRADADAVVESAKRAEFDAIWTTGHNLVGSAASYHVPFAGELGATLVRAAETRDAELATRTARELAHYLKKIRVVPGRATARRGDR